jgi:hypothetical protein
VSPAFPLDCGGEGEIRTRGGIATTPVFKTGALNRSATSPFLPPYSARVARHHAGLTQDILSFALRAIGCADVRFGILP